VIPRTRATPECIRGGYDDALYKSTFTYLLYYDTYAHNGRRHLNKHLFTQT